MVLNKGVQRTTAMARIFRLSARGFMLFCVYCCYNVSAAPIQSDTQAVMYLSTYGYMSSKLRNPGSGHIITEESMQAAISDFQAFAGLNVTGQLDDETRTMMNTPRCGVKDVVGSGSYARRRRRYALQGSRWRVKALTYRISSYPKNMKAADVDRELANAFKVWSDKTDLTFTPKKSGQVHIDIRFARGEHGDGDPFDGPGGTLAHAYFPVYGGDAHFDDSESWTIRSYRGTNLFQVAAHEFGHSLGLSHSDVRASLMAPFYRGYDSNFNLHLDDVQAIQSLYGTGSNRKPATNGGKPGGMEGPDSFPGERGGTPSGGGGSVDDTELCSSNVKIDAIFTEAGTTYVFKGDNYWKLTDEGIAPGYPRTIASTWTGLPGHIDAAFTYNKNGKTYFFKGSQYWRYTGKKMDSDYPKKINDGFQGIPNDVDAAMVWGGNGKIYFFKDHQFYRFDPTSKPPVKSTYPKELSNWAGIPNKLDAALQYTNGYTYFFKQGQYYRFNDRTFAVDTADPAFPRSSGYWWFGCQNSLNGRGGSQRQPPDHPLKQSSTDNNGGSSDEGDLVLDVGVYQDRTPDMDKKQRWDNDQNNVLKNQAVVEETAISSSSSKSEQSRSSSSRTLMAAWSLFMAFCFLRVLV